MRATLWDKVKWRYYARKALAGAREYEEQAKAAKWELLRYCKEKGWPLQPAWKVGRNITGDEIALRLAERLEELQFMQETASKIAKQLSPK